MNIRGWTGAGLALSLVLSIFSNGAFAAELSPKETYNKFHAAMLKAGSIDEVKSFMCKRVNEEINNTPADMKPMMFGFLKATLPNEVIVGAEEVKGDTATLALSVKADPAAKEDKTRKEETTGSVKLIKEGGVWKIDKESWQSKVEMTGNP